MGRLPTVLWLTGCLVAASACQGPISDFPHSSGGGGPREPSRNSDGGLAAPPTPGGGSGQTPAADDDGETTSPPNVTDAGGIFVPSLDAGTSFPLDAGAGEFGDGGVDGGDVEDAGSDGADGQPPEAGPCTTSSTARLADGCSGQLCNTTLAALASNVSAGACNEPAALAAACDGQLARGAALCAQSSTSSLWFDNAVRSCLRSDRSLSGVSADCRDCYTDELLCTLSHCLVACVAELEQECVACRAQHCGAAFSACSGLGAL